VSHDHPVVTIPSSMPIGHRVPTIEAPAPFQVEIGEAEIADLRERLARTRWPDAETVDDWSQGLPLTYARDLCAYWEREYEMDRVARRLNAVPQFTNRDRRPRGSTSSTCARRIPRRCHWSHPWLAGLCARVPRPARAPDRPGRPRGEREDAFHVVVPSLPGYGFGGKPTATGWGVERIADTWAELMRRLGYERYVAQGGRLGRPVSIALAGRDPYHVAGLSLNYPLPPRRGAEEPTAEERADLEDLKRFRSEGMGYSTQQSTRPQTVAYGLTDSPAAQCAWIVEKFRRLVGLRRPPGELLLPGQLARQRDGLLAECDCGLLGAPLLESFGTAFAAVEEIATPTAYVAYPREIIRLSARLARTRFTDLRYYNRVERGGHFAALEVPETFLAEVRAGVRTLGVR